MVLAKDLSHLPTPARTRSDGCPPDAVPRFAQVLAEEWAAADRAEGPRPKARKDARFRHSDAGGCSRAIAYAALNVPQSNPMDLAGTFTVHLGTLVHEAWQVALTEIYGDNAEVEVTVGSGDRAGHIDAVVRSDKVVAIEGKTVGGFAYRLAVGERGPAQGPKHSHVVQVALNAAEVDADEAVVVYWSKDSISVQAAARNRIDETTRFCAEWTFTREEYEPIAAAERARVDSILALVDQGILPGRRYPDPGLPKDHVIVDPRTGRWEVAEIGFGEKAEVVVVDTGTWWACSYCRWQDTCAKTPAGRTSVEVLVEIGAVRRLEAVR